jgi:hypothetical protein
MAFGINDEKLVAYILGELEETEREVVEKALETDEALRQRVAELRATVKLAAAALQMEPAHALTDNQRRLIITKAKQASRTAAKAGVLGWRKNLRRTLSMRWKVVTAAAVAVVLLLVIVVTLPTIAPRYYYDFDQAKLPAVVLSSDNASQRIQSLDGLPVEHEEAERGPSGYGGGGFGGYGARALGVQPLMTSPLYEDVGVVPPNAEQGAPDASLMRIEASQADRYLIKNASLVIETEDARKAGEQLVAAVQELGGYVSDFREAVDALEHRSIQIQVRVPAHQFQKTMSRLDTLGKVLNRHVSTEDVTEEYVDTDARLRNLKRTEERLLAHLDRTGELKGIVEVERELNRVREETERLEGRLRYLTHRVDYSTFNVTLQETPKAEPVVPPETFSIAKIATQATRGLVGFLQGLSKCIVWLGIWSVVWVPLLLVILFLVRRAIRRFRTAPK